MREYCNKSESSSNVEDLCEKYYDKIGGFPSDRESMRRTLKILLDYDKNLIEFIGGDLRLWGRTHPNGIGKRIAFSLYLLSYRNVGGYAKSEKKREQNAENLRREMRRAKGILSNRNEFEQKLDRVWYKRIWAALRDYKKGQYFLEKFKEELSSREYQIWKKTFTLDQLELPGDRWNKRFFKRVVRPLAEIADVKTKYPPKATRELYKKYAGLKRESSRKIKFYPEQMDVSFEFAPRMCGLNSENICREICIFGMSGGKNLCNPESNICPVVFISIGKIVECKREGCPVYKGESMNLCRRV